MKMELLVIAITAFFIYDVYKDQQYSKLLKNYKKYYQMAGIGFVGLSMLIFFKKHPGQGQNMLSNAADMIKYLPIDRKSSDMLTPLLSFGSKAPFGNMGQHRNMEDTPQYKRMMNSGSGGGGGNGGKTATKRSVSETKKKFVASRQGWKCNSCQEQLPAWFEVDHVIRLEHGGSNNVDNLVALCRNCHGKKTAMENM
jgi:hypothetical protein